MATYLFKIRHPEGVDSFDSGSVKNWANLVNELVRNDVYKGITRSFTNQFEFVGSVYEKLKYIWDTYGIDAGVYLTILVGNDNKERSSYEPLGAGQEYKADMTSCKLDRTTFSLNFIDTGYQEKLLSRDGVKVNYNTVTAIDGEEITPFDSETREITLHDRIIDLSSEVTTPYVLPSAPDEGIGFTANIAGNLDHYQIFKCNKNGTDDDVKNIPLEFVGFFRDEIKPYSLILNVEKDKVYKTSIVGNIRLKDEGINNPSERIPRLTYTIYEKDGTKKDPVNIISFPPLDNVNYDWSFYVNYQEDIPLLEGESLVLYLIFDDADTGLNANVDCWIDIDVNFEVKDTFPQTKAQCILPHELFTRLAHILTGEEDSFYSETFGRAELGYQEDGEWAYLTALNGKMIRGFPLGEYEFNNEVKTNNFTTKLRDAFLAYSAVGNLYAAIELIGNKARLRIEKHIDLFDTSAVIDLGTDITNAERSVNIKGVYTAVNVGYKAYEYEKNNGLDSYNGPFTFSTPNKIKDNILDLICKYRADDYGIEFARREQFEENPTTDTRYDKNIFLIDAYVSGDQLLARRSEQYDSVTGILSPEQAYNLNITPKKNLLRHGNILRAALLQKNNEFLNFTDGPNNSELQTALIGEDVIIEKAPVLISELYNPKFVSEFFNIEVPMSETQFRIIMNNPNIMIKFVYDDYTHFGFIDELKYNFNEGKAEINLIRANR